MTRPASANLTRVATFCAVLLLLPALAVGCALAIARTDWFLNHALPPYMRGLESEFAISGRSCDVLVFGDSSALTGIRPQLVSAQTGLRVCSVAQTKGTTGVTGTTFLDMYLARNPAPRVLVLAFAPEDWHPHVSWNEVAYVEGVTQLLRHYPLRQTLRELASHPDATFGFTTFVYRQAIMGISHAQTAYPASDEPSDPSLDQGHMTLPFAAEDHCVTFEHGHLQPLFAPDVNYMRQQREHFSRNGTRVIEIASPVPDCDLQRDWYVARLQPNVDGILPAYPVSDFNDLDRHFTPEGSARYSADLSQLILRVLGAQH